MHDALRTGVQVEEAHARAGAKDLNKLLLRDRAAAKEEATA